MCIRDSSPSLSRPPLSPLLCLSVCLPACMSVCLSLETMAPHSLSSLSQPTKAIRKFQPPPHVHQTTGPPVANPQIDPPADPATHPVMRIECFVHPPIKNVRESVHPPTYQTQPSVHSPQLPPNHPHTDHPCIHPSMHQCIHASTCTHPLTQSVRISRSRCRGSLCGR